MPNQVDDLQSGSAPRTQTVAVLQSGNNIDGTILSPSFIRGKGRVTRHYAGNITTALLGNATHDIISKRYTPKWAEPRAAISMIPLQDSTGMRLDSTNVAGIIEVVSALSETEYSNTLQAPGGANQVKLAAGASALSGLFCDADIEIIGGLGVGQKNRLKSYDGSTKIAKVVNAEGTPNWKVATDATSVARLKTRRYVVDKDDHFTFAEDFTVGTGTAGVDCLAGVDIEFDDSVNV
jgi:hypothetical protein